MTCTNPATAMRRASSKPDARGALYRRGATTTFIEARMRAIRPGTLADTETVIRLGIETGMFAPDAVDGLRGILLGFHTGASSPGHELHLAVEADDGRAVGVVFFGPDLMTDGKWDLWMIAVAPAHQGRGVGSELLKFSERRVRDADGRLLIIETSSQRKYDGTRAFYARHGFVEVARIPDFYADDDAKVICWKHLRRP